MESLIYKLKKNNIKVNVVNDQLKLEIPEGFDPTEILHEVRAKKQELKDFIKKIKNGDKGFDKIEPCAKKEYYTLSSVQKRLYFLYQMDNTSMAYNLPQAVLLEGDLDKDKLKRIFNELVQRHESLRTSLVVVDNEPVQKIIENVDLHVEHYRTTREKAPEIVKGFVQPFDLAQGPLIRVGLIESEEETPEGPQQHILLVDMHHIISDGTSMSILIKEFMALYNDHPLPELKLQYKDYAEWQQSDKRRQEVAKQKEFWSKEFAEEVKPLNLPVDFKRPLMRSNAGAYYGFTINTFEVKELRAIAEQEGTTLFIVLLSLYNILLAKLSNQEDVVVGTPIAGRHHNDLENMIGMFVPSLPLRNYPKGNYTFQAFLDTLKTKIPACFDNQSYEYEELLEELKIERNISYNPLFDFMFSLQNFEKKDLNIPGLAIRSLPSGHIAALFDMTFVATLEKGNLGFGINYSTELFREETIKRFAGYFKKIVSAIVTNREIRLADIDIIPHDEKAKVLNEFNHQEVPRPVNTTLTALFEEQVKKAPERKALSFKEASISYEELNAKVNQLAQYLITSQNVKAEDKVGLYFDRSPELIIAMLAILKSGGTYICLDPEYPADRINAITVNSGMRLVITDQHEELALSNTGIEVIDINRDQLILDTMPEENPAVNIKGSDAAYVIYTSGSTGEPKGVIIEHDSMLDYAITFRDYFELTENDRIIQQSSFSFDTVVEEIFPALISGGQVIVMPDGGRDIDALVETIQTEKATLLSTTPVVLNMLNGYANALESLRVIISGGDLLLPSHINHLAGKFAIYNTYGPSESTVCITYNKVDKLEEAPCIGRPIDNRQVYIMNQTGKLCPIGVPGELCVSGKGLARGYLGDERLTREKFVDNPVIPGKRMYRTGDLAKWLPDGKIEFLGRVDDQVKIRGIRIELKEIESHLLQHNKIREVVVITKGSEMEKHLVAYYVADEAIEVVDLRDFLKESLPNHMIPSYFVHLEKIPLTANSSKLDKKALPEPEILSTENYEAASGEIEEKLVELWSEILKIEASKLSVTRSFFEMGGHSLKAALLINRLRKELSIDVPLKEVFKNQNIRSLAKYIDGVGRSDYAAIEQAPEKDYYTLSAAQRRLYFLYEYDKASIAYNIPQVVKLEGELDKERLNQAFTKLINRHESLRTCFDVVDDEPVQKITRKSDFEITWSVSSEEEVPSIIRAFIRPFDLARAPLIRAGVVELSATEFILMVDLHHIITDGFSQGILVSDFMSFYNGEDLPELKLQYKDYSEWQQSEIQQDKIAKQKQFWLEQFSTEVTPLELPTDFARTDHSTHQGDYYGFTLEEKETHLLKSLAESEGSTMFMALLGIFNVLLSKLSNQEDVVIGTTMAGREHDDLTGMIGMFVNTLPLRYNPEGTLTYREFLNELKSKTLAYFDNQAYPYEELVDELKIVRDTRRNPLFDIMFGFQNFESSSVDVSGLKLKPYHLNHSVSKFDISLTAAESRGKVFMEFSYAVDLFARETMERFAGYMQRIIAAVIANPDIRLADIEMLPDTEQARLLQQFNNTGHDYPREETLISLFDKQVDATPDNIAVEQYDNSISYRELNEKANQLAYYLLSEGIKEHALVGVMFDKSPELIISIIAILKTGAAYLPLDPAQPIDRNQTVLQESRVNVLLTGEENQALYKDCVSTIDIGQLDLEQQNKSNPGIAQSSDNLAYVLFTSGSTGKPKGVMIRHQSVINLIYSQQQSFGIDEQDRIFQFSTIIFDASVEQVWLALLNGAALILPDRDILSDNDKFNKYIKEHGVTHLHTTPSFLENVHITKPNSLKRIVTGGEECRLQTAKKYFEQYDFYNKYGPTETTVTATMAKINAVNQARVPIGKPINNTALYVLGTHLELLPSGTIGELYIGGEGLAAGYLYNEELTRERFIANPYQPGKLMYRTGDLVRVTKNGDIEFIGRADHQVKIRGFRIELGEIEHHLATYDAISEVVVMAREKQGDKYLVAYYVSDKEIAPTLLKGHLQSLLPDYMVPAYMVHLEFMPLNANGKTDRKALPEPNSDAGNYEAPVSQTEKTLVRIWSEILKLEPEQVSVAKSFFEMGGHSLRATVLVNRIAREMEVKVPLREIFRYQDIRSLAQYIDASERTSHTAITKAPEKEYYALSAAQRRLYFLYEFDKTSVAYNMPQVIRLKEGIDRTRLAAAFKQLINRHESLRTSFIVIDDEPQQKIHQEVDFRLDYYCVTESEAEGVINSFVRPFDLSQGPLIRVGLIESSEAGVEDQVLMVDMHHIITDGVSQKILVDDFMALYHEDKLPELTLQYKDYAEWQQAEAQQEQKATQRDFWMELFADEINTLDLPADYARPRVMDNKGEVLSFELSKEQSKALMGIAEANGATMFMVILSVYNILLAKLGNQEDIIVGTPVAGRQHADLERMIGMFVNTLPLRNRPKRALRFDEFLSGLKAGSLLGFENQAYPYEQLVDDLRIERDTARNPLFDVMFSYQNMETPDQSGPGIAMESLYSGHQVTKFDLSLSAGDDGERVLLSFEYATCLFTRDTISKFVACFKNIIKAITADASIKIGDIDILGEVEKKQLLEGFNPTARLYPEHETVISCFMKQAEQTPGATAIRYKHTELTYQEVDELSDKIARYLRSVCGVDHGQLVGVVLERNEYLVPCLLGILKTGAAYVPIDPAYPNDRKAAIISDSGLKLVIAGDGLCDRSVLGQAEMVTPEDTLESLPTIATKPLEVNINADDLAYVIYTSGSTGKPKGVMIEHGSLMNIARCMQEKYPVESGDSYLMKTSHSFDVSCAEIFGWYYQGGSLTVLEQGAEANPVEIIDVIAANGITHLNFVPSMFSAFVEELKNTGTEKISSIKYIFLAGEALNPELVRMFKALNTDIVLENIYGPTEATIYSCGYSTAEGEVSGRIPIGKPLSNVKLYVLDSDLKLQPIGVPGELCIAGAGVARGYLNNEALTNEKFIDNPYQAGTVIYKTGDLVRWTKDGNIEFLGRIDHQVKVRGYRIELGEIEYHLAAYDSINEVVVMARESDGDKQLVAYYISGQEIDAASLKSYLHNLLPDYMVPAHFVHLESMPLNANGKIDRKALPEPEADISNYVAPEGETEIALIHIWGEILKLDTSRISVTKSFFELGGHSLRAIALTNRISREMQVEVPLREIFRHQDVRSLARYIEGRERKSYAALEKAPNKEYYALSAAQRRLYFLYEFDKKSLAYNMPQVIRLKGGVDKELLSSAFEQLIARHESLRTSFVVVNDEPQQKILEDVDFRPEYYRANEQEAEAIINKFIRPFDLGQGPLIRVGLIESSEAGVDDQVLMVDMHHIITDGVSQKILVNDFMTLYNGGTLPKQELQYKDYAEWQQGAAQQEHKAKQKAFWENMFAGEVSTLDLPSDYVRPTVKNDNGDFLSFELSQEQTRGLKALASTQGSTMFMVVLGIYNVLLSRLSNQEDIIIGTPVAGREHSDLETMIGMFVNTLPLRFNVRGDQPFHTFLSEMQAIAVSGLDNQAYPYEELVEALNLSRDTSRNPLFDVMFSFHNQEEKQGDAEQIGFETYSGKNKVSQFDLTLIGAETNDQIVLGFEYATSIFKKETITRFAECFKAIVSAVLADDTLKLSEINILPAEDRELFDKFNDTAVAYPEGITISDLFEAQVKTHGSREAVLCGDQVLNYEQFNEQVNRLSNYLLDSYHVGKEDRIGIYASRSPEMLVAMMAILKSGAAYIPLDPEYPAERIKTIIDEAGPRVVITDLKDRLAEIKTGINVVDLVEDKSTIEGMPANNPCIAIEENDAAYIIYTSGSTGKPKGIVIEHSALVDYSLTFKNHFSVTETDKVIQQASFSFDTAVEETLPALISGGAVIILPSGGRDIAQMIETIEERRASILSTTPLVLNELNHYADRLSSLRAIISGGDLLLPRHINNLIEKYPVYNTYGPSESTVCVTYHRITDLTNTSHIGKPIANREIYITNSSGALCPVGVAGELCVSGKGLAREYLGRPDLTAEKFAANQYASGKRIYRTGDLARWRADGSIEFLGRIDDQVKIRGYRIEPGEVERCLSEYKGISEVAVMARGEEDKYLVAYYAGDGVESAELRTYLSANLPTYMVPAYFVSLDTLPLTANGKLDKKALPVPKGHHQEEFVPPSNEVEETLAGIWAEVLEIDAGTIGVNQNFFELGGQSIKATKMLYRIGNVFEAGVSLVDIFTGPTIAELARKILKNNIQVAMQGELLVPLKRSGTSAPNLFFVHDGSGDVQGYVHLAKQMSDYNCWGLRSSSLHNAGPVNVDIEQLASEYIARVKTIQPQGPYQLAGWSTGGSIAFEMVRQLEEAGEKVDALIMIDTVLPVDQQVGDAAFKLKDEKSLLSDVFGRRHEALEQATSIAELWERAFALFDETGSGVSDIKKMLPGYMLTLIPNVESLTARQLMLHVNTIRTLENAMLKYSISGIVKAPLIYLKARETDYNMNIISKNFEKEIIYSEIWGDHFSILQEPQVNILTKEIEAGLENRKRAFLQEGIE